ncbi:MAG: transpeptidase family protein [Deltaproteobacteria bacterium]|nr:transpeptidase family protein [Deltaproteobacteria bacterium]
MKVKEKKWIRFRIYLVAFFFLVGLGVILARAYQLQVLERGRLSSIAQAGYRGVIKLPPKRGTIYDREGRELAVSIEVGSIYAHPKRVKKKRETARLLSKVLHAQQSSILRLLKRKRSFVWIDRKIAPEKIKQVQALELEGIGFTKESRRYYPGREIASHLIGFAGEDNQGLEGLEKKYEGVLRGPQHTLILMRDALKRPFFMEGPSSEKDGMYDLVLTIDNDIQYKAQQALGAMVKKTKAKSGNCVVVNPETGEILAMAVVPHFNPNVFGKYHPSQWRNRSITDVYEPGSTIKVFLLAAALESNVVSPQTQFDCENGKFVVANHVIHDTKKHGSLSVSDIVVYSSNIGAVKIGRKIGYERFAGYLRKFGFGEKTGIDLLGERRGFVRSSKKARELDKATLYFGQGMSSSSLQLAMAMAAVANGGKLMRPYVVAAIKDQDGRMIKKTRPKMVRRVISRETAGKVARILEGVVSERGTGPRAAIMGYRVAGKTGTSQKVDPRTKRYSKKNFVAIFAGFVPVSRPRLVIVVSIDEPRGQTYGGLVAGPVFRDLGAWTLKRLHVSPEVRVVHAGEEEAGVHVRNLPQVMETEVVPMGKGRLPDFGGQSMREVMRLGSVLGLKLLFEGSGLAVKQHPAPGVPLKGIKSVKVLFRPPV